MRLTSGQLRQIIKEETEMVLLEQTGPQIDFEALKSAVIKQVQKQKGSKEKQGADQLQEGEITLVVAVHLAVGTLLAIPLVVKYLGEALQYLGKAINFTSNIFGKKTGLYDLEDRKKGGEIEYSQVEPGEFDPNKEQLIKFQQKVKNGEGSLGDLVNVMGNALEDQAQHWLHEKYIKWFEKVFGTPASWIYFLHYGKKMPAEVKNSIGKLFFYVTVMYLCYAALNAGIKGFAEYYGPTVLTNSEFILGMIKLDELAALAGFEEVIVQILSVLVGKVGLKKSIDQSRKKQHKSHHDYEAGKHTDEFARLRGWGQHADVQVPARSDKNKAAE